LIAGKLSAMKVKLHARRHITALQKAELVAAWQSRELSLKDFAEQRDIAASNLHRSKPLLPLYLPAHSFSPVPLSIPA